MPVYSFILVAPYASTAGQEAAGYSCPSPVALKASAATGPRAPAMHACIGTATRSSVLHSSSAMALALTVMSTRLMKVSVVMITRCYKHET